MGRVRELLVYPKVQIDWQLSGRVRKGAIEFLCYGILLIETKPCTVIQK